MKEKLKENFWDLSKKFNMKDKEDILDSEKSPSWIYFLYGSHEDNSSGVVYVGQSVQPRERIKQHYRSEDKKFSLFNILPVQTSFANVDEAFYISKYTPPYNKEIPKNPVIIPLNKYIDIYPGSEHEAINYMEKMEFWSDIYGDTYIDMVDFYDSLINSCVNGKGINLIKRRDDSDE